MNGWTVAALTFAAYVVGVVIGLPLNTRRAERSIEVIVDCPHAHVVEPDGFVEVRDALGVVR